MNTFSFERSNRRYELMDRLVLSRERFFPDERDLESLPAEESFLVEFNVLALVFGPFYYFATGMWLKGLCLAILTGFFVALGMLLPKIGMPNPAIHLEWISLSITAVIFTALPLLLCALLANYDRYRHVRFNETIWPLFQGAK